MQKIHKKFQIARKYIVGNWKVKSFICKTLGNGFACQTVLLIIGGAFIAYLYILSLVFQHTLAHFLVVNLTQFGISTCYEYYNLLQFLYLIVLLLFSSKKSNFPDSSTNLIEVS